ncbi:MAG: beta-ketoacyl synthase N-terminal-like domain-containing protein [bacterium]
MNNPIVITGIGILSPLGIGVEETAAALREGEPALLPCSRFTPPAGFSPLCGEVPAFRAEEFLATPKAYLDRQSELLLAATGMALRHAGLDAGKLSPERSGILVGTAWAGQDTMAAFFADYVQKGPRLVKPFLFPHTYFNTAISLAAMEWSLRGVHQSFASGRVAAGQALVEACDLLADDAADVILAGGSEALGPALCRTLAALGWLKPAGNDTRPGLVPGEAGVMLALERRSHAAARGATMLATICGAGLAATAPAAAQQALQRAGISGSDLALVVSSANGQAAVAAAEAAVAIHGCPVLTPATLCGDTQGACAALHLALAVLQAAQGPALVLATDAAGGAVALVVGR